MKNMIPTNSGLIMYLCEAVFPKRNSLPLYIVYWMSGTFGGH